MKLFINYRTSSSPAAALIDSAVSSDDEMIRNVGPLVDLHLEILNVTNCFRAVSLSGAVLCASWVNNHEHS